MSSACNDCLCSQERAEEGDVVPLDRVADEEDGPIPDPVHATVVPVAELGDVSRRLTGTVYGLPIVV